MKRFLLLALSLLSLHCGGGSGGGGSSTARIAVLTEGIYVHTGAGSGRVAIYEVGDGSLLKEHRPLFAPRGVAILGSGIAVATDGTAIGLYRPLGAAVLHEITPLGFEFLKTVCATSDPFELVCADQALDRIVRFRILDDLSLDLVFDAPTGRSPRGLADDGQGGLWVACKNGNVGVDAGLPGFVVLHSSVDGRELARFETPFGCRGLALDLEGRAWVACFGDQKGAGDPGTGNLSTVVGLDPFGFRQEVEVGRGPFAIACDVKGHKLVSCTVANELHRIEADHTVRRGGGWPVAFDAVPELARGGCTTVALDGWGRIWVAFKLAPFLAVVDGETGALLRLVPVDARDRCETLGDATGYSLALLLFPSLDLDFDGVGNLDELATGTNPFERLRRAPGG
jgi:hypothetical protein